MIYTYETREYTNLQKLVDDIEQAIGVRPFGVSSGSARVNEIEFTQELTPQQKQVLDIFMEK